MAKKKDKHSMLPAFLTILGSFISPMIRDFNHNNKVKKFDQTAERVEVCENLLVKAEKKQNEMRKMVDDLKSKLFISWGVQALLLLLILLRVFNVI